MSSEIPSETNRMHKIAGSFKGKLSSLLHLSRAPIPSIEMDSSSDNRRTSILPLNMVPVVGVDHAPTTAFATEADTLSPGPPILVPISGSIPMPKQLQVDFTSERLGGLETPPTHVSLATRSPLSPSLPDSDAIMQVSKESEHNLSIQDSGFGCLANPQNVLITSGTFIVNNILPANPGERHMKTSVLQKPNSSSLFVGRKDVLDTLRKIFIHCADNKLMSRRSCLLWGTGGIGKTQICLKFIEEMSDRLSHVFWVDASSEENITMSLRGISSISAAQASCLDDSVESVLQWISGIQEEWLIVFDNADVPPVYVVEKYIPPGNRGNILITSRNQSMGRVISFENIIEINEMEEADAITLLLKASRLGASAKHIEVAKNIVTELGCMPLAVDQAGAYIEVGRCSINKYLQQFSLHRQTLMSDATFRGASNYDRTVYGTWDLSFKEIKRRASEQSSAGDAQAAHAAILILQICAFYHHSNISKDIFRSAAEESGEHVVDSGIAKELPLAMSSLDRTLLALDNDGHWDEFIFGQGIAVLLSFSLMKRDESSEMLSAHPLVHCWSREQISKSEQQRMYEMGSIILCCAISQRLSSYDYGLRRLIFPHIKANESHGSQMGLTKKYYDDKWNNFIFVMRPVVLPQLSWSVKADTSSDFSVHN